MVRFSDTFAMTGRVLRRRPSIVLYPFFALLLNAALQELAGLPALQSGRLEESVSKLFIIAAMYCASTAFTYPILQIGYGVAKDLNRPTHVSWNPWIASFGLAFLWIPLLSMYVTVGVFSTMCLVVPGVLYFSLLWPVFPLVFGPRFTLSTALSLAKKLIKESPLWLGSLGFVASLVVFTTYCVQVLAVPTLGVDFNLKMPVELLVVVKVLLGATLSEIGVLACIYPMIVALMLAEDLHDPIFNAEYEAERRQDDLEELDDYFEDSVLPALMPSPDHDAKVENLRNLYARGIISADEFNREMEELQSF